MNIMLTVAYDGTNYVGFQKQKNGISIQEVLENALFELTKENIKITASGRTDAGVHAVGQVVNFTTKSRIPAGSFFKALNPLLPSDIKVLNSKQVDKDFNARKSAKRKTYVYSLYYGETINPLLDRYAVLEEKELDIEKLNQAKEVFVGEHDFKCFCASGSSVKTTVRTIYDIEIIKTEIGVDISVTGNGFLYNMIRTLVGTLIKMEKGDLTVENAKEILSSGNRKLVGKTYPAKGLKLKSVIYC